MLRDALTRAEAAAVDALADRCRDADGTDPLNEEARLARGQGRARHGLIPDGDELAGYLFHDPGFGTSQLMVDPARRQRGVGRTLVAELGSTQRLWAFGDLPPAQRFAATLGLAKERELLVMRRDLGTDAGDPPADDTPTAAPAGPQESVRLRGFRPDDAGAFLDLNAATFAHHPEQGSLDAAGLAARMAEPWFDPAGLILAEDDSGLLGFHWTKRRDETTGEVYVIGVHPRAQGRGLGRTLLQAGLDHLGGAGCRQVLLYVDSAERIAVEMYATGGFHVAHRDVLYASAEETP